MLRALGPGGSPMPLFNHLLCGRRRAPTSIPQHHRRQMYQHLPQLSITQYANQISQGLSLLLGQVVTLSHNPRRMYINISMSLVSSVSLLSRFPATWHMRLFGSLLVYLEARFPPPRCCRQVSVRNMEPP
jgi:hypothetical protein